MAHFAQIDENNIVTTVIVIDNKDILDSDNNESEEIGIAFCNELLGGVWKQTSYNSTFRYNYAGIGHTYDEVKDAFIAPQPFPSWNLNANCQWEAPVEYPLDGGKYSWDEDIIDWVEINKE